MRKPGQRLVQGAQGRTDRLALRRTAGGLMQGLAWQVAQQTCIANAVRPRQGPQVRAIVPAVKVIRLNRRPLLCQLPLTGSDAAYQPRCLPASRRVRPDKRSACWAKNARTASGRVRAWSRRAQPIALRVKNSVSLASVRA